MFLPRIIPILLLKGKGLVKTVKFKEPRYIGDPINAVKIFNDLKADELVFLDITASREGRTISLDVVKDISEEAYMPFAVGGGIRSLSTVEKILETGCEKVVINSALSSDTEFVKDIVAHFGAQSLVISIDVRKNFLGKYEVYTHSGTVKSKSKLEDTIQIATDLGAGEIIINSIDLDGVMKGYDLKLIKLVADMAKCPTVACGGAGSYQDLANGYYTGGAHSLAAGSLFVYHGPRNAVLINYPSKEEIMNLFKENQEN
ncbi:AglZ/HisF2 family acetamidino modification protein [Candidatus Kapaibacterium sp.]